MGIFRDFIDRFFNRKGKAEHDHKEHEMHEHSHEEQKKKEAKTSTTDVINVTELKKDVNKDKK